MNDQIVFGMGKMKFCLAVFFEKVLRLEYFHLNMPKVDPRCMVYISYLCLSPISSLSKALYYSTVLFKECFSVLEATERSWHLQWFCITKYYHDGSIIHGSVHSFLISKTRSPSLSCHGFRWDLFKTFDMASSSFWVDMGKWSLE